MGVTNGFLKLNHDEFEQIRHNAKTLEKRLRGVWGENSEDYLDMDKAGYELLTLMKDDSSSAFAPLVRSLYPNIFEILGGGETIIPTPEIGYMPACIIDPGVMRQSIHEFNNLKYDTFHALAMDSEMLDDELKEEFEEYHWGYLQTLGEFVKDAVANNRVVLRY